MAKRIDTQKPRTPSGCDVQTGQAPAAQVSRPTSPPAVSTAPTSHAASKTHIHTEIPRTPPCGPEAGGATPSPPIVPTQLPVQPPIQQCPVIPPEEYQRALTALDPLRYNASTNVLSLIQTHITALGTIGIGTWGADPIAIAFGGTGVTSWIKGGILAGIGASSTVILPPGADGTVLIADSSQPSGLVWSTATIPTDVLTITNTGIQPLGGYFIFPSFETVDFPTPPAPGALVWDSTEEIFKQWNGIEWSEIASGSTAGVTSFNTRTGDVTLTYADVTSALGYGLSTIPAPSSIPVSNIDGTLNSWISVFTGTQPGLVPLSAASTTKFLRADSMWVDMQGSTALVLVGTSTDDTQVELRPSSGGSQQIELSPNTTYICRVHGTARESTNANNSAFYEDVFGVIRGETTADVYINGNSNDVSFRISTIYAFNSDWSIYVYPDTATGNVAFVFQQASGQDLNIDVALQVLLTTDGGAVIGDIPVGTLVTSFNGRSGDVVLRISDVFTDTLPGIVPPPMSQQGHFLRDDGTWAESAGGSGGHGDVGQIAYFTDTHVIAGNAALTFDEMTGTVSADIIEVSDIGTFGHKRAIKSFILNRDLNGDVASIVYEDARTVTFTRDIDGQITSYTDEDYVWSINRIGDVISGVTVTPV